MAGGCGWCSSPGNKPWAPLPGGWDSLPSPWLGDWVFLYPPPFLFVPGPVSAPAHYCLYAANYIPLCLSLTRRLCSFLSRQSVLFAVICCHHLMSFILVSLCLYHHLRLFLPPATFLAQSLSSCISLSPLPPSLSVFRYLCDNLCPYLPVPLSPHPSLTICSPLPGLK